MSSVLCCPGDTELKLLLATGLSQGQGTAKHRFVKITTLRKTFTTSWQFVDHSRLQNFTQKYCAGINNLEIKEWITKYCSPYQPLFCQFLVDCSVLPEVIAVGQVLGDKLVHHHLFRVSRTWCYTLHRDRLKILGRWRKWSCKCRIFNHYTPHHCWLSVGWRGP